MYKYLIFDLDDTLTNDYENCKIAFTVTLNSIGEEYSDEKFLRFREIDKDTWDRRAKGELLTPYEDDKIKMTEWIRASRFMRFFGENIFPYEKYVELSNTYMHGMKEHVVSRPNSYEVIKYLFEKGYKIIIATNGPLIPLKTKIEKLGITEFIDTIFSAEEVGFMKPNKHYYDGLLKKAGIDNKEEVLFIGDDLDKDIKGGIDNGLDTCWCNYKNQIPKDYIPKYEITELMQIKDIL